MVPACMALLWPATHVLQNCLLSNAGRHFGQLLNKAKKKRVLSDLRGKIRMCHRSNNVTGLKSLSCITYNILCVGSSGWPNIRIQFVPSMAQIILFIVSCNCRLLAALVIHVEPDEKGRSLFLSAYFSFSPTLFFAETSWCHIPWRRHFLESHETHCSPSFPSQVGCI